MARSPEPAPASLTDDLVASYQPAPAWVPQVVEVAEPPAPPPKPRPIQEEALRALAQTRADGFGAGMVTMATGLGKTWLAAFDALQARADRVLFIAHREEILKQSRDVFRLVRPEATMGLYFGGEKQPAADFVFATVQTLSGSLHRFAPEAFDYVIVDEFHHAAAATYRKVIDYFTPQFLLGLTATLERMDGADLLSLCADNLVFQCDLVEGIRRHELVPFHYWGVPDPVDFAPIPWRNGRFDPEALEQAIETQERAQSAFDEWQEHRGGRTLAFCASKHHSDFMNDFFLQRGVRCASVHSGPSSAPRHQSIDALRSGELEVIFTVDIFNEGLDVPDIDTVLMRGHRVPGHLLAAARPRAAHPRGKGGAWRHRLHRQPPLLLAQTRTLLSLGRREPPTTLQVLTALESNEFGLPEGCSVDYDLTVIEMLKALSRTSSREAIEEYCRTYMEEEGLRPTAAQTFRAGHDPAAVTGTYGNWFNFLRAIDLLGEHEAAVVDAFGDTLRAIQVESITKSYKLITIRALLHEGALRTGDDVANNAEVSRRLLLADPRLAREVPLKEFPDLAGASRDRWANYWRKWPIAHLTGTGPDAARATKLFRLDGDRIVPTFVIDEYLGDVFDAMAAELIEYRLASYLLNKEKATTHSQRCGSHTPIGISLV